MPVPITGARSRRRRRPGPGRRGPRGPCPPTARGTAAPRSRDGAPAPRNRGRGRRRCAPSTTMRSPTSCVHLRSPSRDVAVRPWSLRPGPPPGSEVIHARLPHRIHLRRDCRRRDVRPCPRWRGRERMRAWTSADPLEHAPGRTTDGVDRPVGRHPVGRSTGRARMHFSQRRPHRRPAASAARGPDRDDLRRIDPPEHLAAQGRRPRPPSSGRSPSP